MKNNKTNASAFDAIKIEGGLLTSELLNKLRHYDLLGQSAADYSVEEGLKLNDELGRYWRIAKSRWERYNDLRQRDDVGKHKLTVDDWLIPLLEKVLDYRVTKISGFNIGERTFPIEHIAAENSVPLVLFSSEIPLDSGHPNFGEEGRKRSPSGLAQEYLNAEDRCLWALVSNGLTLRLLRDNPAMTRPAYVEIDLERIFEEDLYVDFTVFWLLLHATRLQPKDGQPDNCFLEQWRKQGDTEGERVRNELRFGVTDALRILGTGFVSHPDNNSLRELIQSGELNTDQFFQELLRLIYRFLFLLTAEDRNVLLDPDAESTACDLYEKGYSISNLREQSRSRRHYDNHTDAWQQLVITLSGFATGQPKLGQPAMGGLFTKDQCLHLEQSQLANRYLFKALFKLGFFVSKNVLVRINYRDMDTEELGSVYESLLELIPKLSVETPWKFGFEGDNEGSLGGSGHQRKLTGSYYTPDSLVQELIQSALEPVIEQHLHTNLADPTKVLLSIKVCDPACGSGHFLLAAARRIATELARITAGVDQPTDKDYAHALREVVRHCIYGVDVNPLSVELCRTALWLETIEPGKPLGFLDAHIQVGNALVGVLDPQLIQQGIPDEAYKPLTGDDKKIAAALKKRNQIDKTQKNLLGKHETQLTVCAGGLEVMPEEKLEQIEHKRATWLEITQGSDCQNEKLRADMYTAAFFSPKTEANAERVPTNVELATLERNEFIHDDIKLHVEQLAKDNRFFHWFLAFPEVFEKGGFDVMLGNPPWDVSQLAEEEYFSVYAPSIAQLSGSRRKLAIEKLENENPYLWSLYKTEKHSIESRNKFYRTSGRYKLTAKGKLNLYALFAEHFPQAISINGRAGFIVPSGIASDDSTKEYFSDLNGSNRLVSLFSFENEEFIFPSVHHSYRFCLLTISGAPTQVPGVFVFFARQPRQIYDVRKRFCLTSEDISLINPNTNTCPVFRSERDAELTKKIYRTAPVLIREGSEITKAINPWGIWFSQGLFNITSASHLFKTQDNLEQMGMTKNGVIWHSDETNYLPLYEGKMVHQYDHRWATYENDGKTSRDCTLDEKQNSNYYSQPRYWVDEWQVTLRTARAPKLLLDAAKKNDVEKLQIALQLWCLGAALLKGDEIKVKSLMTVVTKYQGGDILSGCEAEVSNIAKTMAEQWGLSDDEYYYLTQWLKEDGDVWQSTRYLLNVRRPKYLMGWRDVTSAHVYRTVIVDVFPLSAVGHTCPLINTESNSQHKAVLLGNLNSLIYDFIARQKVGGNHLTYGYIKQFPTLTINRYTQSDFNYIVPRILELTYTSFDLKPFAEDLGYDGDPFSFDPDRRHHIKCDLDAYYSMLYGINREELRYILDPADVMGQDYPSETFRVLKNKEIKKFGEYRTRRLVLEAWDKLHEQCENEHATAGDIVEQGVIY